MDHSDATSRPAPRLGVNYTPRRGWFHHWLDFDLGAVREDLAQLAAIGLDHVRVFCLWPVFQPHRGLVRPAAIDQLVQLVDAAADAGLDVSVDPLQGHLSSFDFVPSWMQTWHRRNMFTDDQAIAGQCDLLAAVTGALADHPAFLGMTLGNETNQFADPSHPEPAAASPQQIDAWLERLLATVTGLMPHGMHQHSFDDRVWFDDRSPVTPRHATSYGDATTVHSWVFTGVAKHYGTGHPAIELFTAYLVALATAWADDPSRPVWVQEVGAPSPAVPAESAADFLERTIRHVVAAPNVWGVTWWCSHDVDPRLLDFPDFEYTLGLFTATGDRKPAAERLAALAAELRTNLLAPPSSSVAVVADVNERSQTRPGSDVFEAWMRVALDGRLPAIVFADRADDRDYVARRGIDTLLLPHEISE